MELQIKSKCIENLTSVSCSFLKLLYKVGLWPSENSGQMFLWREWGRGIIQQISCTGSAAIQGMLFALRVIN